MANKATARFLCEGVTNHGGGQHTVQLRVRVDPGVPEAERFGQPWGEIRFGLQNKALLTFFEPGESYMVEIRRAPPLPEPVEEAEERGAG